VFCFVVVAVVSAGLCSTNLGLIFKHWPLDIGRSFCLSVPPSLRGPSHRLEEAGRVTENRSNI
jgi:hypothetical protein